MIKFFTEAPCNYNLPKKQKIKTWIIDTIKNERAEAGIINIIFCNDEYLLNLNKQYLQHNEFTDIITFDNSDTENIIECDIFISIDRVKENANTFNVIFINELHRVIIHGILHLLGYKDKTTIDAQTMRNKESECLQALTLII